MKQTRVFIDLEGAAARHGAPGIPLLGAPGKSQLPKRTVDGPTKHGSQASIAGPGSIPSTPPGPGRTLPTPQE